MTENSSSRKQALLAVRKAKRLHYKWHKRLSSGTNRIESMFSQKARTIFIVVVPSSMFALFFVRDKLSTKFS